MSWWRRLYGHAKEEYSHGQASSSAWRAIPIMWVLSRRKLRLADALGSRALRADAMESITCGSLSFVVLIGVLAQLVLGAWWVDAVTSLVIVGFLVKEGREAWTAVEDDD
jgi:divalent metal cation (Fe/Co/Zn/Cd) transporter